MRRGGQAASEAATPNAFDKMRLESGADFERLWKQLPTTLRKQIRSRFASGEVSLLIRALEGAADKSAACRGLVGLAYALDSKLGREALRRIVRGVR